VRRALQVKKEYLLIASFLFLFALQQAVEGAVWLGIAKGNTEDVRLLATIFLSFSHLIWPVLAPLAVTLIESSPFKRRLFFIFTATGLIFGCSIYLPLLFHDKWLAVELVNYSIFYDVRIIYDGLISRDAVGLFYAAIITVPMFLSSNRHIRFFGLLLFLSGIPAYFVYYHAFISVWCFFGGILSLYIVYILTRVSRYRH